MKLAKFSYEQTLVRVGGVVMCSLSTLLPPATLENKQTETEKEKKKKKKRKKKKSQDKYE